MTRGDAFFTQVLQIIQPHEVYTLADMAGLAREVYAKDHLVSARTLRLDAFLYPFIQYVEDHQLHRRPAAFKLDRDAKLIKAWLGDQWLNPSHQLKTQTKPIMTPIFGPLEDHVKTPPSPLTIKDLFDLFGVYSHAQIERPLALRLGAIAGRIVRRLGEDRREMWLTAGVQQHLGTYYLAFPRFAVFLADYLIAHMNAYRMHPQFLKQTDEVCLFYPLKPYLKLSPLKVLRQLKPTTETRLESGVWLHPDAQEYLVDLSIFRKEHGALLSWSN